MQRAFSIAKVIISPLDIIALFSSIMDNTTMKTYIPYSSGFNPNRSLDFSRIACNCRADFFCVLRRRSGLRQVKDKRKMCGKGMQSGEELNQNTLIRSNDRFGFNRQLIDYCISRHKF